MTLSMGGRRGTQKIMPAAGGGQDRGPKAHAWNSGHGIVKVEPGLS